MQDINKGGEERRGESRNYVTQFRKAEGGWREAEGGDRSPA